MTIKNIDWYWYLFIKLRIIEIWIKWSEADIDNFNLINKLQRYFILYRNFCVYFVELIISQEYINIYTIWFLIDQL